jgi:hypothetical protein
MFGRAQELVITELMASGQSVIADVEGSFPDWLEIHNPGTEDIELSGWHLTDNADKPQKWAFPARMLPAGGYLVVFASGKAHLAGSELHASFSLRSGGEYLALTRPDGSVASSAGYPVQMPDVSYEPAGERFYGEPTPGAANTTEPLAIVSAPIFSEQHGYMTDPFLLELATNTDGAQIRYTTDGTEPTESTGLLYEAPIEVRRTSVIRAAAFAAGSQPSAVITRTYLFMDDVVVQSPDGKAPKGWPKKWGMNHVDYGMDPRITQRAPYNKTIRADLQTIPALSIVMDLDDLFDPAEGIYANPQNKGREWERPMSIERIEPNGPGFQVNAGLRIRGGASRDTGNAKHSFRVIMRKEYGAPELDYPLFGPNGAARTSAFDIRCEQLVAWHYFVDPEADFIRDIYGRDTQGALGQPYKRGDFHHLFINGQYWGLYQTDERVTSEYAAEYFGGNSEDYDVVKFDAESNYGTGFIDGTFGSWRRLFDAGRRGFEDTADYFKVQGLNPDGSRNREYERLLDVDNLIDYMLAGIFITADDSPPSFGTQNNWYGLRSRKDDFGFRFFAHDWEISMRDPLEDRVGPQPEQNPLEDELQSPGSVNPWFYWQALRFNPEFRLRVADHAQKFFFNGGALTKEAAKARWLARMEEIDRAVVGESARWGDARQEGIGTFKAPEQVAAEWREAVEAGRDVIIDPGPRPGPRPGPGDPGNKKNPKPFKREDWFRAANGRVLEGFLEARSDAMLQHLKDGGLFPSIPAPTLTPFGGELPAGRLVTMSIADLPTAGRLALPEIYYTTDGTDPRRIGGEVAASATRYLAPFPLVRDTVVKARARAAGEWSALVEVEFTPGTNYRALQITELYYNALGGSTTPLDGEFLELKNTGDFPLNLSGARFTAGIDFTFPEGSVIEPGAFVVLARDLAGFSAQHPGATANGVYAGRLNDDGETLTLVAASGARILSIRYDDETPWPLGADGAGFSIVPTGEGDPDDASSWRVSSVLYGTPGQDDLNGVEIPTVVVNEVLSRPMAGQPAAIELLNASSAPADISGWWITDTLTDVQKFRVPDGTVLPPGGFKVFTAEQFASGPTGFTLGRLAGAAWLVSADSAGTATGYAHGFDFGAALEGLSFGRHLNSAGDEQFPMMESTTLGAANAAPYLSELRISEINYFPPLGGDEFLEIENLSLLERPLEGYMISGLAFAFPPGAKIAPEGRVIVTTTNADAFRAKYKVPAEIPIFGPTDGGTIGVLQDNGERVSLLQPVTIDATPGAVSVDSVRYNDRRPWPTAAAGFGASLQRLKSASYADDPQSWLAAAPSPGQRNTINAPPRVQLTSPADGATIRPPQTVLFAADATDVDGSIARVEFLVDNVVVGQDDSAPYEFSWRPVGGLHDLTARAFDRAGASADSEFITIDVDAPDSGIGLGLRGEYFRSADLSGDPVQRDDARIAFDWMERPPMESFPQSGYSVRWTGKLLPRESGDNTLYIRAAGGVRLYVAGELVVDQWDEPRGITEIPAVLSLVGGELVDLRLEYAERDGGGFVELRWAEPGKFDSGVLPQNQLYLPSQDPSALGIASVGELSVRRVGRPFRTQLQAISGTRPYSWSVASGSMPAGVSLAANGLLSGTPVGSGSFSFTVRVLDGTATAAERVFTLRVIDEDTTLLPKVQILAPAAGGKLSGSVNVTGLANAPRGLGEVRYSLNDGPWHAFAAARRWSVKLDEVRGLLPGRNLLRIVSVDIDGRESAVAERKFEVIVRAPLTVAIEGAGAVTPSFLGTTTRVIGRDYTITATPAPGYVLQEWRGAFGNENRLRFTMQEGLEITAVFVPNPFSELGGEYTAFVDALEKKHRTRGAVTLSITRNGAFTGVGELGDARYRFRGKFGVEGFSNVPLASTKDRYISLNLFWDFASKTIDTRFEISEGEVFTESQGIARLAGFDANSGPCPFEGEYNLVLTETQPAVTPLNAIVKVGADGRSTLTTTLNDGTDVTALGLMRRDGSVVFYAKLYDAKGSLAGEISFFASETEPISGRLFWSRPVAGEENAEVEYKVAKTP